MRHAETLKERVEDAEQSLRDAIVRLRRAGKENKKAALHLKKGRPSRNDESSLGLDDSGLHEV